MKDRKKPTSFGRYIKKRLIDMDMQQKELAEQIGTTPATITYIIYGERPADKWVEAICYALGDEGKAERYSAKRRKEA